MTAPPMTWESQFIRLLTRVGGYDPELTTAQLPPGYPALTPPALAVRDILRLNSLSSVCPLAVDLWQAPGASDGEIHRLQVYSLTRLNLDELMPYLQNLRLRVFDQLGFTLTAREQPGFIHSFFVARPGPKTPPLRGLKPQLLDALTALLAKAVENDALNGLLTLSGMPWRDIDLFRAYGNYYFQWNPRCTPERFHQALQSNPGVVALLFRYFEARFRPDPLLPTAASREEETLPVIRQELGAVLDTVGDGGSDRILRDLFNLIDATLRTNHYLHRNDGERFLALKMDSMGIFAMPSPKPHYEIYVHSPTMEGVHLRGGKVARGGIRWSDRMDDFREEILDLMQTQMIKNALIVPHGAKGGFILKTRSASRQEARQQARTAYKTLIRGLLDLTDNRTAQGSTRPAAVLAYDDDDPYLVVAADKGTSHFSDLANSVAAEYRFWLGDAFASGGSHGYDHKVLGITARGAWECVKLHFAEMGRDPERQPVTVVGIGSMEGDVFGNGMLLSRHIRLLGAFGSRHIFLDPDPDPELSFQERQRLFRLNGSNWTDYDPALISPGGGVFPRDARSIPLSPPVRSWLGVRRPSVDGEELARLLLIADVDLLWLGGIGTYVKAAAETHDDAGDRSNDSIRVDACQLRAKVVGEGANLGFTQSGRIEFALAGGRINTDAVDNSAGVDLSDHEVNLKILMKQMETSGLTVPAERDPWLIAVRDEICASVLAHNKEQGLCLSLDMERCRADVEPFLDTADDLARAGYLDRRTAFFPSRKEIIAREGRQLTRPDLAILMPCSKLALKQTLLEHDLFITPWTHDALYAGYFPKAIRERFSEQLPCHSLAREIAASRIANWIIGRAGSSFLAWSGRLEADSLLKTVSAYLTLDRVFSLENLRNKIRGATTDLPVENGYRLLIDLEDIIALACRWLGKRGISLSPDPQLIGRWQRALADYLQYLAQANASSVSEDISTERSRMIRTLELDAGEANLISFLESLTDFPALMEMSERTGADLANAAGTYFRLARELGIDRLLSLLNRPVQGDQWERRTRASAAFHLRLNLMRLSCRLLTAGEPDTANFFKTRNRSLDLDRFKSLCRELMGNRVVPLYGISAVAMEFEGLMDDGRQV